MDENWNYFVKMVCTNNQLLILITFHFDELNEMSLKIILYDFYEGKLFRISRCLRIGCIFNHLYYFKEQF